MRKSAGRSTESAKQWAQVMQVMPGLVLGFLEVTVLHEHQRGDFDPVADAGQPCGLHPDFLPGPPEPRLGRACRIRIDSTNWWVSWPSFLRGFFPRSSFSTPAHRSQPVRSYPGLGTFCRCLAIACCTVEQRYYLRFCCLRTAIWPDPTWWPKQCPAGTRVVARGSMESVVYCDVDRADCPPIRPS